MKRRPAVAAQSRPPVTVNNTEAAVSRLAASLKNVLGRSMAEVVVESEIVDGGGDGDEGYELRAPAYDALADRLYAILLDSGAIEAAARMAVRAPTCSAE